MWRCGQDSTGLRKGVAAVFRELSDSMKAVNFLTSWTTIKISSGTLAIMELVSYLVSQSVGQLVSSNTELVAALQCFVILEMMTEKLLQL